MSKSAPRSLAKNGAVIITYNPDNDFELNLAASAAQLNVIIIVDNGSTSPCLQKIKQCASKYSNVILIENNANLGIAKALNIGCQYLYDHQAAYALLLDQDSLVTGGMVDSLLQTMSKLDACAVVSPKILAKDSDNSLGNIPSRYMVPSNGLFYKKALVDNAPLKVLFNITSGSLIDLAIWQKIGKFEEDYFIEGVDNEYGLRVNSLGYFIVIDHHASLVQQYGNQQIKMFLGRRFFPTFHSPLRHYYVARNRLMIWKKYYKKYPYYLTWDLLSFFNTLFLILAFENNKYQKIKHIGRGFIDAICGKKGKYDA
ncbi:glycosyltransferase family 2 protein [Colwellia sp. KU-HH00111]|uniref:glycosyltransferase family 2 protein n=1 Tax=Colwellia sp. KU-HH00111 TaxID=3127652 RepID=UPI0031075CA7